MEYSDFNNSSKELQIVPELPDLSRFALQSKIGNNSSEDCEADRKTSLCRSVGSFCRKKITNFLSFSESLLTNANALIKDVNNQMEIAEECKESCEISDHNIKTLEDALNNFELATIMGELDASLEDVRKHKKSKKDHENVLKDIDKQLRELSRKFHPDRVQNDGGSEVKLKSAQNRQADINTVRTVLKTLTRVFLEDIETDHRYVFYTKIELKLLANENEVKKHVYEVLLQIGFLSDIKQRKVILEIQKFLEESQCCVQSYLKLKESDFKKQRDSALIHLRCCIEGYEKLQRELKSVENYCKNEKLDNIISIIRQMASDNKKTLKILRDLEKVALKSLRGSFKIFTTSESLDEYFVSPFFYYVNVILMCNVMVKNRGLESESNASDNLYIDSKIDINDAFNNLHKLVLSFIEDSLYEELSGNGLNKKEIIEKFDKFLTIFFNYILKSTFKKCDYTYNNMSSNLFGELEKCKKMMFDFQTKEKELSNRIENLERKTKQTDEEYEMFMNKFEDFKSGRFTKND